MSNFIANKQTKDEEYIPMNSLVAFGARTPTFGRTEYFLGEVVLTWKHTKTINLNSQHNYSMPKIERNAMIPWKQHGDRCY